MTSQEYALSWQFIYTMKAWLNAGIGSVQELAKVSGHSASSLYRYECRQRMPSKQTAEDILQAMGVIEKRYIEQWRAKQC